MGAIKMLNKACKIATRIPVDGGGVEIQSQLTSRKQLLELRSKVMPWLSFDYTHGLRFVNMNANEWEKKRFTQELNAVLPLRDEVFQKDVGGSPLESDGRDLEANHAIVWYGDAIAGYARWWIVPSLGNSPYPFVMIDRFIICPEYRCRGFGKQLFVFVHEQTRPLRMPVFLGIREVPSMENLVRILTTQAYRLAASKLALPHVNNPLIGVVLSVLEPLHSAI